MKRTNNSRFGSVAEWNNQGQSYDVDDIENLSQKILNNLKGGDMVILHDVDDEDNTPEEIAFITSFLNEKTIMLNVCLGDQAGYVIYTKDSESGQWEHTTTQITPIGGGKLYKHSFIFNQYQSDSAFIVIISKSNQNLVENGALVKNISTLGTYMLGGESWVESATKKVLSIINFDKPAYPSQKSIQVVQFTDSGAVKKEFAPTSVSEEIEEY